MNLVEVTVSPDIEIHLFIPIVFVWPMEQVPRTNRLYFGVTRGFADSIFIYGTAVTGMCVQQVRQFISAIGLIYLLIFFSMLVHFHTVVIYKSFLFSLALKIPSKRTQ